jgi:hypothetical protein
MSKHHLALDFVCPICNAQPNNKCELTTGAFRFQSHAERKWIAQDHNLGRSLSDPEPTQETVEAMADELQLM